MLKAAVYRCISRRLHPRCPSPTDTVALDVGAHFGGNTLIFSQLVGPGGRSHSFEQIPHTFEVLAQNCRLNQAVNVRLNRTALGAESGEGILYLPDIGSSGAFCLHRYQESYETFVCPVTTLDRYMSENGIQKVDLIKADIEGAELDMLEGSHELLQSVPHPIWIIEIQEKSCRLFGHSPQVVFQLMADFGYQAYYVLPGGKLKVLSNVTGKLPDYNFVFVHRDNSSLQQGNIL